MIFTLETDSCHNPTLVFNNEDEATDCFLLLMDSFPSYLALFACWDGYYNALTMTGTVRDNDLIEHETNT